MRIRRHNVGDRRWHLSAYFNDWREKEEFQRWIKENISDCFCVYRDDGRNRYFEIRGSDLGQMMVLFLRWSGDQTGAN